MAVIRHGPAELLADTVETGITARVHTRPGRPAGTLPQGDDHCFESFVAEGRAAIRGEHPDDDLPAFDDGARTAVGADAVLEAARTGGWMAC